MLYLMHRELDELNGQNLIRAQLHNYKVVVVRRITTKLAIVDMNNHIQWSPRCNPSEVVPNGYWLGIKTQNQQPAFRLRAETVTAGSLVFTCVWS